MFPYLRLEIVRMFRDRRFVFLSIAFPVVLYLLWTGVFPDNGQADPVTGLKAPVHLMVAFACYGAISAALTTTGQRLALERQSGWLRQLQVTPLRGWSVIVMKSLAAMTVSLPSLVLVAATALTVRHVHLSPAAWVALIVLLWIATLPFVALGVLIGSAVDADSTQPIMMVCLFALAIIGGLWVPVSQMPGWMRSITEWLPSNRFAEVGWDIAAGHAPSGAAAAILAGWTVVLGGLAVLAYRRASVRTS